MTSLLHQLIIYWLAATKVVSLNPARGEVYMIQHYVIKVVSDLQQAHLLGEVMYPLFRRYYA
jgi:hypothetical protein